jgi:hypothetical protein
VQSKKEAVLNAKLGYAVVGGLVVGALAWIDPLFIPLVLLGPIVSGLVVGIRGGSGRYLALAWVIAGVSMIVSDWVKNHEDVAFHVVLTVVMVALSLGAWAVGRKLGARRRVGGAATA